MAFELNIAVKRGPIDQPSALEGASHTIPCPVTVVEVNGELSPENSVDLTQRLTDIVSAAPSSVIIRFVGEIPVSPKDVGPIETVAVWVKHRRRDGCNLYVEVSESAAREAFLRIEEMKNVMLPFGADASVPRRIVGDPPRGGDG